MRVRIKQAPSQHQERWIIETKNHWYSEWEYRDSFWGDQAQGCAMQIAEMYLNPKIIELTNYRRVDIVESEN
jgi:hypothetical protein